MFSSRFRWSFEPNRISRALEAKRRTGPPILDLTQSNPTRASLMYPPEIVEAFRDERILRYEPAAAGMREAREAVARYYSARGIAVEPERILLTASTSEGYAYLFKLLTDPGDHVLVPRPSYPLFEFLAAMESIEVRPYRLAYHGAWSIDLESVHSAISERTRAIVLVNPNNPTGSYVKRGELKELVQLCAERRVALISDEVFADYAFGPDPERVSTVADVKEGLAFAMSGLSKVAGLPQMKLGWIVAAGSGELRRRAMERLEWIADTYLSVGTPVQSAAQRLLEACEKVQREICARTLTNLHLLQQSLEGSPANMLAVEGGWYAILQMPRVRGEEEWALELLNSRDVLLQPGFFYDFESEAYLVASLLTAPEVIAEGLRRLRELLKCT